jgi:hypothetical protein
MHTGKLDQAALVANYLLPTSLYPAWGADDIRLMTERLQTAHPQRPLMMQHLSSEVCPQLMQHLRNLGWKMIATRRVFLSDPQQTQQPVSGLTLMSRLSIRISSTIAICMNYMRYINCISDLTSGKQTICRQISVWHFLNYVWKPALLN